LENYGLAECRSEIEI